MTQEQIPQGILSNFKISKFYHFLIYIGSIILVLSLFLDVKNYDVSVLRSKAFITIAVGLIIWIWYEIMAVAINFIDENDRNADENAKALATAHWVVVLIILGLGLYFFSRAM